MIFFISIDIKIYENFQEKKLSKILDKLVLIAQFILYYSYNYHVFFTNKSLFLSASIHF